MSESRDPNLLTSEELAALVRSSGADSANGISATEARLFHEISLSAFQSAKHLGTLATTLEGTPTKAFGIFVTVGPGLDPEYRYVVINVLQPQITANTTDLATAKANIQTLTGQTSANTTDLATAETNIQTLTGQTSTNTTDLGTAKTNIQHLEEAVEKRWKEIHADLVRLIEAEWESSAGGWGRTTPVSSIGSRHSK